MNPWMYIPLNLFGQFSLNLRDVLLYSQFKRTGKKLNLLLMLPNVTEYLMSYYTAVTNRETEFGEERVKVSG